ncbi:hypothetical protein, partial [Marilutibacter spongiae]|uniref:hypothetical protein n=1 Tax=Marilutibacter spongiae TaxID=2025720 RepID=UPI001C71CBDA
GLGLTQEADDLLFGKALLHVQSPYSGELDSRSPRYSKPGGRRLRFSNCLTSRPATFCPLMVDPGERTAQGSDKDILLP